VKKIFTISLALFMLFSSLGVSFAMHFCMGRIAAYGLVMGADALSCGMSDPDDRCPPESKDAELSSIPCCTNQAFDFEVGDTDQPRTAIAFTIFQAHFSPFRNNDLGFVVPDSDLFLESQNLPPPLEQDYCVLHQSFLL
jgi:hypothetical protein